MAINPCTSCLLKCSSISIDLWTNLFLNVMNCSKIFCCLPFSFCRGCTHANARGGWEVPIVLANLAPCPQGGGKSRALSRPRHPACEADPQHGDHDGHLWAHRLPSQAAVQLETPGWRTATNSFSNQVLPYHKFYLYRDKKTRIWDRHLKYLWLCLTLRNLDDIIFIFMSEIYHNKCLFSCTLD